MHTLNSFCFLAGIELLLPAFASVLVVVVVVVQQYRFMWDPDYPETGKQRKTIETFVNFYHTTICFS
jgi:hypothetical protein